jgi:lysophospholipase L1-like esterase
MIRTITDVLKLYHLRLMFKVRASNEPTPVLSRILQQANKKTSSWGGKMYFVYLPARGQVHPTRDFVLKTVKDLNIPIIDLKEKIFDIHPDPLSLFPLRLYAHYNAKGYELIAEVISKKLKEDGFNTPNQ